MQPQVAEHGNFAPYTGANGDVYYNSRNFPMPQQSALRSASVNALHHQMPPASVQPSSVHFAPNPRQVRPQQPYHHASMAGLSSAPQGTANEQQQQQQPVPQQAQKGAPIMRGWLFHWEGWPIKFWQKRWAVLRLGTLNIYKSSTSDKLLNSFLLHNYQITMSGRGDKNYRRFAFRCEAPGLKTLFFASETEQDMNEWVKALQSAVQPMGTFHSHPPSQQQQQQEDVSDYAKHSK